jgi:UDP-N-acetylglucosamine 1-carboxyvinyltransferase
MDVIHIEGGRRLSGTIQIGGAKNSTLPIMAACLLTEDTMVLSNIPHLMDIVSMANLLLSHGTEVNMDGDSVTTNQGGRTLLLNSKNITSLVAPYEIVRKMRASVLVLGPLLTRFGEAKVSLPGGCAIGTRPVDLHLKALEQMGADIIIEEGYIVAKAKNGLKGATILFDKISVGATENALTAATLAKGTTTLQNAAMEPEITDLVNCLNAMGAKITGTGTSTLVIEGVEKLHGAHHNIIPDRVEACTYAIAAAITGGKLLLKGIDYPLISNVADKMKQAGVKFEETKDGLIVSADKDKLKAVDIQTQEYPGFSTDMQAQFMALMCIANGTSTITENIFENRFMHVAELSRMGADISLKGNNAIVNGVKQLRGSEIMATDLRASVCLVLAGLASKGDTYINRIYHIDRGYEQIESKLAACGAKIERISSSGQPIKVNIDKSGANTASLNSINEPLIKEEKTEIRQNQN